jgi:diadenylate cyclase
LELVPRLLNRVNQALQTLERYKTRLDSVTTTLSALEVEDLVTVRDVVTVLQRAEMVRRIAEEIEGDIVELGTDGRLALLQLEELMGGVDDERRLVIKDYFREQARWHLDDAMEALTDLSTDDLIDLGPIVALLRLPGSPELDSSVQPRGYRLLSKVPRLPDTIIDNIVEGMGTLQKAMRATIDDLDDLDGIGSSRARTIKEGLARLAETSILDRYT